jgi:hypothetical protein
MASTVPSPPSAIGIKWHSTFGSDFKMPLFIRSAALIADRDPLNLSGQIRIFIRQEFLFTLKLEKKR